MNHFLDFSDRGRVAAWQPVNDVVMGGRSGSTFLPTGHGTAVFSGRVSLDRGGGFASVRSDLIVPIPAAAAGLCLNCRGDGKRYKLSLRTYRGMDGISWQAPFLAEADRWHLHRFAWQDFQPTRRGRPLSEVPPLVPAQVVRFGLLIADRQEGPFRLELAWLELLISKSL